MIVVCVKLSLVNFVLFILLVTAVRKFRVIPAEEFQGSVVWRIGEFLEFITRVLRK